MDCVARVWVFTHGGNFRSPFFWDRLFLLLQSCGVVFKHWDVEKLAPDHLGNVGYFLSGPLFDLLLSCGRVFLLSPGDFDDPFVFATIGGDNGGVGKGFFHFLSGRSVAVLQRPDGRFCGLLVAGTSVCDDDADIFGEFMGGAHGASGAIFGPLSN